MWLVVVVVVEGDIAGSPDPLWLPECPLLVMYQGEERKFGTRAGKGLGMFEFSHFGQICQAGHGLNYYTPKYKKH